MTQFPLERIREAARAYFEKRLNDALELTLDLPDGGDVDDLKLEIDGFEHRVHKLEQSLKSGNYPDAIEKGAAGLLKGIAPGLPETRYTGSGFDAVRIARKLVAEAEVLRNRYLIMELSGGTYDGAPNHPIFRDMLPTQMPDPDRRERESPLRVEDAINRFKALKSSEWSQKTQADQARSLALACEVFGPTELLVDVTKEDVQKLRDVLMRLPKNALKSKDNAGKSLVELATEQEPLGTLSFKTRDKYFSMIRSFLKWAVDEEFIEKMPGLKVRMMGASSVAAIDERDPYSDDQLAMIFRSPLYAGFKSLTRRSKPGDLRVRDAYFWIPLVGLFSGMRLGEIVQLRLSDLKLAQGKAFFDVCIEEGTDKTLKTALSARQIPVHPELTRLGFLKYVEDTKKRGVDRIFYEIAPSKAGYFSGNFSKWWGRYGQAVGFHAPTAVFHSFRHNFTDAMRQANLPEDVNRYLDGHADKGKDTHHRYGSKPSVARLDVEISKIRYQAIQAILDDLAV